MMPLSKMDTYAPHCVYHHACLLAYLLTYLLTYSWFYGLYELWLFVEQMTIIYYIILSWYF